MAPPGPVEPGALESLLAGADPRHATQLGADRRQVTVAGFDLTFCAPKSVSLLHALGDPEVSEAVHGGHRRAVEAALGYVEDRALAVRRAVPGVGRVPVPTELAPAAAFLHRTALGVAWGPLDRGRAEVAGVSQEARREFSRRSAEIADHLGARGLVPAGGGRPSPRASAVAAAVTRAPKDLGVSAEDLRPWWRERARAVSLGPVKLEGVLQRVPARERPAPGRPAPDRPARDEPAQERPARDLGDLATAVSRLRPPPATFARRHVVHAWASSRQAGESVGRIEDDVDRFIGIVSDHAGAGGPVEAHDRPGVAERRHVLPERFRDLVPHDRARSPEWERRRLEQLLHARGMSPGREYAHERGGPELGLW